MVKAKAKGRMLLQKVILIDKAPCRLACGLLPPPPNGVFVVEYQTAALKALNNKDSQRKTVKSMTVSNRALICSFQSSKVAPPALLLAPTSTEKVA